MAEGVFTIPLEEYYSKSSEFKGKVTDLITSVETNFINKVSNNLDSLDSQDKGVVEAFASYTEAKSKLETLKDHETVLLNMSSEGANNPLNGVVSTDRQYSGLFSGISQGAGSQAVAAEIGTIDWQIARDKMSLEVQTYIKNVANVISDNDIVQRILLVAKKNPAKALEMIWANEKIVEQLIESNMGTNLLGKTVKWLEFFDKTGQIAGKLMSSLANNNYFVQLVDKAPVAFQDKVLNIMIKISENSWTWLNKGSKIVEWAGKIAELQPVKWATKWGSAFAKSSLGKVALSPWTSIGISGVTSVIDSYTDPNSKAYGNVGRAVAGGLVDAVASVGPIEGLLIGASVGGGIGAGIGFGLGLASQIGQFLFPDAKKAVKNWAYDRADDIGRIGKSISTSTEKVVASAGDYIGKKAQEVGKTIDTVTKKAKQLLSNVRMPSLSWFG